MRLPHTVKRKFTPLAALCLFFASFQGLEAREPSLSRPLVLRWLLEEGDLTADSPGFQGETLYVQTSGGAVSSVQSSSGRLQWRADVGGSLSATPVASERAVYVASERVSSDAKKPQGLILALSRVSGITLWSRTLSSPLGSNLLLSGKSLFGATKDGRLFSLDSETGETLWDTQSPYSFSDQLLISGQNLITSTTDGIVASFDHQTGRPSWRYQTRGSVRGAVAVDGSKVFFGSADGYVIALEESAAGFILKWRRRAGTSVVGVTHTAAGLIVVTADNFVQLLSQKRGSRVWKQRMPGRVFARPLTDSENALFATIGGESCIVLSLARGRQVNVLSVGEGNSIVAMPVLTPSALIVPTRTALMAFAQPEAN